MEEVFGATKLHNGNNEFTPAQAMDGKEMMFVYFGAHWVPPCRLFNNDLTKTFGVTGGKCSVVFVSYDGNQEAMTDHMLKHPKEWFHIKLEDEVAISSISSHLEADELPHVAVIRPDGSIITTEGRKII